MSNSVDPDGAVWSLFALFGQPCLVFDTQYMFTVDLVVMALEMV